MQQEKHHRLVTMDLLSANMKRGITYDRACPGRYLLPRYFGMNLEHTHLTRGSMRQTLWGRCCNWLLASPCRLQQLRSTRAHLAGQNAAAERLVGQLRGALKSHVRDIRGIREEMDYVHAHLRWVQLAAVGGEPGVHNDAVWQAP